MIVLSFTLTVLLLNSFSNSYTFAGGMTVTEITNMDADETEIQLTSIDTGTVSVKLKDTDYITLRRTNSNSESISYKEFFETISVDEEYIVMIDIYKFPLNLIFRNKIEYIWIN